LHTVLQKVQLLPWKFLSAANLKAWITIKQIKHEDVCPFERIYFRYSPNLPMNQAFGAFVSTAQLIMTAAKGSC
jgi:hypothetical protein